MTSFDLPPADDRPNALALASADFDAYLPERATSNAFTRPRLEVKQRMLAWARGVLARLAELQIAMDVTASDEHPSLRNGRRVDCQRVFFWRDAGARGALETLIDERRTLAATLANPAPHRDHAFLALKLDAKAVAVSIELAPEAWVDLRNLRARLADEELARELDEALAALPEQFLLRLEGEDDGATGSCTAPRLVALLGRAAEENKGVWLGWAVPREVAVDHSALLDEQLEDAIVALGPVYKLIAWAQDNDLSHLEAEWDAAREKRRKTHEEAERDRVAWEERQQRAAQEGQAQPRAARVELRAQPTVRAHRDVDAGPSAQAAPGGVIAKEGAPGALPPRPLPKRADDRPAPARQPQPESAAVEVNARVRILSGPFAGKVGVVQELDGRGGARVLLGLLAMSVPVKELTGSIEGRDRPTLATSHRRLPTRS